MKTATVQSRKTIFKVVFALMAIFSLAISAQPVHAAGLGPTITGIDNRKPAVAGGTVITITGTNLDTVSSVAVDNSLATISAKAKTSLTFIAPQHALGDAVVLVTNPAGTATILVTYSPQRRPIVPSPTLPATLKVGRSYTVKALQADWKVTLTTDTPKTCSVKGAVVKGLRKGNCALNITIDPDPVGASNPNWRGKIVIDSILIN